MHTVMQKGWRRHEDTAFQARVGPGRGGGKIIRAPVLLKNGLLHYVPLPSLPPAMVLMLLPFFLVAASAMHTAVIMHKIFDVSRVAIRANCNQHHTSYL